MRAIAEARRFVERYPNVTRGLFLTGPPGVGKTHIAVGVARELTLRLHEDILFADFADELQFRLSPLSRSDVADREWEKLKKVSLLILDDFGWLKPTEPGVLILEDLLQARGLSKKITILTGSSVRCRALFGINRRDTTGFSAAESLLSSLSRQTVMRLLVHVKILSVTGKDFRRVDGEDGLLF